MKRARFGPKLTAGNANQLRSSRETCHSKLWKTRNKKLRHTRTHLKKLYLQEFSLKQLINALRLIKKHKGSLGLDVFFDALSIWLSFSCFNSYLVISNAGVLMSERKLMATLLHYQCTQLDFYYPHNFTVDIVRAK